MEENGYGRTSILSESELIPPVDQIVEEMANRSIFCDV